MQCRCAEALLFGSTGEGFITLAHLALHHAQDLWPVHDVLVEVSHTCPPSQGHRFPVPFGWMLTAFGCHGRRARARVGHVRAHETLDHLVGLTLAHPSQVAFPFFLHFLRRDRTSQITRDDELGIVLLVNYLSRRIRHSHDV